MYDDLLSLCHPGRGRNLHECFNIKPEMRATSKVARPRFSTLKLLKSLKSAGSTRFQKAHKSGRQARLNGWFLRSRAPRPAALALCAVALAFAGSSAAATVPPESELYAGWLKMYDLRFDEAHRAFAAWKRRSSGRFARPASNAAAYLFSELARLGALGTRIICRRFPLQRARQAAARSRREGAVRTGDRAGGPLADAALQRSGADTNALFVKSLTLGLRADNSGLIEKQSFAALGYTKEARVFSERLAQAKPEAADAYLGPGVCAATRRKIPSRNTSAKRSSCSPPCWIESSSTP